MFESIVCGVDGSPAGLEALRQASVLRAPEGELLGLVVCEIHLAVRAGFEASHAARRLEKEAEEARATAAAQLDGVPFSTAEIVRGRPVPALLGALKRRKADLLAVGTHGTSRPVAIMFGSVASEMLHQAPCPVLVAREAADGGPWLPRAITVGVDGSDCSLEALGVARALGERFEAPVRRLACTGGKPVDVDGLSRVEGLEWDERHPVDALVAAAAASDIVIVGSRGLHGLASLGSVSERVAHRAACSVLTIRGMAAGPPERG
ncbi:MAG TPA: universal stress protein [Gaiellaceae bacterium]|nr:universal stress protein [Gaiellaceae bacterium]